MLERMNDLVNNPQERMNVEIKQWIDLSVENHRANLAKALIALANHGGGMVLLGFKESDGWHPDPDRPASLDSFSQDVINGIVQRYAEPVFHCEVRPYTHSETGHQHPVINVPPGDVPIRSKRDGPDGRHVSNNTYYIRRPGPCSEAPRTGEEWNDLIRRCILARREDMISDIRHVLAGIEPLPASEDESVLSQWVAASLARWTELVSNRFGTDEPSPYSHGWWTAAYLIADGGMSASTPDLLRILGDVPGYTGWSPWWVPTKPDIAPYPYDGLIECWLGYEGQDAGHADFWRASGTGTMFLLRGYQEDGDIEGAEPGKLFDLTLPVWRVGEVMMHAASLASALGKPDSSIEFHFRWGSLQERRLSAIANRRRHLGRDYVAHQDSVETRVAETASSIGDRLPELVMAATRDLYTVFDFFEPGPDIFAQELERMRSRTL